MQDAEMQHAVEAAVLGLPEMERAVLVLYHQEELSYEGIAAALGMPINTVRTHLHRGRKRLSEVLRGRREFAGATANAMDAEGAAVRGGGPVEQRAVRMGAA
jgi:RNA polymerase sigma-70 factor (ECF subfamily)